MWFEQAWRDPWVFPVEEGFEMLVTARVNHGPARDRGVIGRASSGDLVVWRALPPLTAPGGFAQMEVPQRLVMDGEGDPSLFVWAAATRPQSTGRFG